MAFPGGHPPPGEDHAERLLLRDNARQAVQAAGERREAHPRFGKREDGVVRRDDQVAGERDLEAPAHRETVDRGDYRLGQVEALRQPGETACRAFARAAGRLVFQVVAGGERLVAGAGDDRRPLFGVGGEIVEYRVELEMRRRVQRVVDFGPVDGHHRQPPLARHLQEFVFGHRSVLLQSSFRGGVQSARKRDGGAKL